MKITVIFTGGTIGSTLQKNGIATDQSAPRELLARYRAATNDYTTFKTIEPYTLLSENLTFSHLTLLADTIEAELNDADGVIVTHGTDTLPYTAAALSYIFGLCPKPVMLVSSNYILGDMRANGVDNFCAAVDFLRQYQHARGVYVSYRNGGEPTTILRAARLLSHLAPTNTVYTLGGTVALWNNGKITPCTAYAESADLQQPLTAAQLEKGAKRVLFLRAHPGMVFPKIPTDAAAVLLETYHSGTLPTESPDLKGLAACARATGIPVFAVGITGEATYESTNVYPALGILPLPPLSPVAAYMKLALSLANGLDPKTTLPLPLGGDM